jgi:hypothetical protein
LLKPDFAGISAEGFASVEGRIGDYALVDIANSSETNAT